MTVGAPHVPLEKVPGVVDSQSFVVASPRGITLVAVCMLVAVCVLVLFQHIVDVVVFVLVDMLVFVRVVRHMSVVFLVGVNVLLCVAVLVALLMLVRVVVVLYVVVAASSTLEPSFGPAQIFPIDTTSTNAPLEESYLMVIVGRQRNELMIEHHLWQPFAILYEYDMMSFKGLTHLRSWFAPGMALRACCPPEILS